MKSLSLAIVVTLTCFSALASDADDRLRNCNNVLKEILKVPDAIPQNLLDKAECAVVIPGVKKFAVGLGGSYGRGAMLCRSGDDFDGPWGPPSMVRLEGGSIGFQLGGSATDFVLLVMNKRGAEGLLASKVKLGADATAAAGPKGRSTEAATDASLRAEILSYSRSRGLIAGVSLKGSTVRPDGKANENVYGQKHKPREIVLEGKVPVTKSGEGLVETLQKASPVNRSN